MAARPGSALAPLSLASALDAAWRRAVAAREAEGERRRADADRAAASRLWAAPPSLALSHRDDRLQSNAGRREVELGVALPLWLPGQRAAQVGAADAAVVHAQAAEDSARLQLAGELREAAWQLVERLADVRHAEIQAAALQQLADDVDRRVRAGDLAPADSLAAQAEALDASGARVEARQRLQVAQTRWSLLTGSTAAPDLSSADTRPVTPIVATDHPAWRLARASTELARQRVELMRHSRRDAPELSVGVRQDTPGRGEASQGSVVVGLRWPFGTEDRNRPMEASALSALDIAKTHEERLRERLDSEMAAAHDAHRVAQAQLDTETRRARLLRERFDLIEKSFRAGESSLPDLLRAKAAAALAEGARDRQTAALGLARARLQQAIGLLP